MATISTPQSQSYVLQLRRTIKAPVQRLYEALERNEERSLWLCSTTSLEPVVGGVFQSANGTDAEFLEVYPCDFWRLEWKNPRHRPGSIVVIKFVKNNRYQSTIIVRHWRITSKQDFDELQGGWLRVLNALQEYLEEKQFLDPAPGNSEVGPMLYR